MSCFGSEEGENTQKLLIWNELPTTVKRWTTGLCRAMRCSSINHRKALKILMKVSRTSRRYSRPFYYYSFAVVYFLLFTFTYRNWSTSFLRLIFFQKWWYTHWVYVWIVVLHNHFQNKSRSSSSHYQQRIYTQLWFIISLCIPKFRFYSYATLILALLIKA